MLPDSMEDMLRDSGLGCPDYWKPETPIKLYANFPNTEDEQTRADLAAMPYSLSLTRRERLNMEEGLEVEADSHPFFG